MCNFPILSYIDTSRSATQLQKRTSRLETCVDVEAIVLQLQERTARRPTDKPQTCLNNIPRSAHRGRSHGCSTPERLCISPLSCCYCLQQWTNRDRRDLTCWCITQCILSFGITGIGAVMVNMLLLFWVVLLFSSHAS